MVQDLWVVVNFGRIPEDQGPVAGAPYIVGGEITSGIC